MSTEDFTTDAGYVDYLHHVDDPSCCSYGCWHANYMVPGTGLGDEPTLFTVEPPKVAFGHELHPQFLEWWLHDHQMSADDLTWAYYVNDLVRRKQVEYYREGMKWMAWAWTSK